MYYRLISSDGDQFADLTLYKLGQLAREGKISRHDAVCGVGPGFAPTTVDVLLGGVRPIRTKQCDPPALSWITTMVAGALTGGYLLNVPALRLGIWSWHLMPKPSAILVPLIGLMLPPAHLVYALMLIWSGGTDHVVVGLLHLVIGFFAVEAISIFCAAIASVIIRQTMLTCLTRQTGLRISFWFTLFLNSIYLTYKTGELRAMYGLLDN